MLVLDHASLYPKMTKKCIFSETKIFPTLLNQNLDVFSMDNVFSDVSEIVEEYFWSVNELFQKNSSIFYKWFFALKIS